MNPIMKYMLVGILTHIPKLHKAFQRGTGGTNSARYCYSVWLRHLTKLIEAGMPFPNAVAEFGPGDSIGIGLAALLSTSQNYTALDVVQHANVGKNIEVFDELVQLFNNKADIPDDSEFPGVYPKLANYSFPHHILHKSLMERMLEKNRLNKIRADIKSQKNTIRYYAPWDKLKTYENEFDLIISQAVMEHVDDLHECYKKMILMLNKNGWVSHQIDFSSHSITKTWNGHYYLPPLTWKIIRGRLPYLINRRPPSYHIDTLNKLNIEIKTVSRQKDSSGRRGTPKIGHLTHCDIETRSVLLQGVKKLG